MKYVPQQILSESPNHYLKNKSLKSDLLELEKKLIANPNIGTSLGNNVFKIRLAIKSKGKGKSSGARIITYLELETTIDEETMTV